MEKSELSNKKLLRSKNIYDVYSSKDLKYILSKAFKNEINLKKQENKKIDEARLLKSFLNSIKNS